jgi:hypothetical protein
LGCVTAECTLVAIALFCGSAPPRDLALRLYRAGRAGDMPSGDILKNNKYAPHLVARSGGSGWTDDCEPTAFGRSGSVSLW